MAFTVIKESISCEDCCEINLVITTYGHREWEERCAYSCAHCGTQIGARHAVTVSTQKVAMREVELAC